MQQAHTSGLASAFHLSGPTGNRLDREEVMALEVNDLQGVAGEVEYQIVTTGKHARVESDDIA